MAFFYLNKLEKSITKNELEKECSKFGQLKSIRPLREDSRNAGLNSTIAEFTKLDSENGFLDFCKSKKIFAMKRKEETKEPTQKPYESKPPQQNNPSTSTIANPSFHFYKDKAYGKAIENFQLTKNYKEIFEINGAQTFTLTTTYPGLLVGSGYNHPKLPENKEDFQLGFFFDHTTGLPLINGSSIKGLIRSVFPDKEDKYYQEKKDFLKEEYKLDFADKSIENIFDNNAKVIFYDAFILETKNTNSKIFGTDYITSHYSNEENGMFKEPNPVKFLKVLPEVTFKFQFKAPKEHVELFKAIILDFGLGAKTNVGYGKFKE
ncbi:MAG: type III-B CRISPR module RAMP protein Cmr6 [Sulfurimonas sp. RIFOXYD2_FULL_37_8]|nr:MAG: type III-B CRISPR module RAMP protein Cmr6 [Sulfurimonas sp. RIFOXYD2_FULL_37_8]